MAPQPSLPTLKQRKAILEAYRKDAGGKSLVVPATPFQLDQRTETPCIGVRFDVRELDFSATALPAMPQAGDVVGIYPPNTPEHAKRLLSLLKLSDAPAIWMSGRYENDKGRHYTHREALTHVALNPVKIELLQAINSRLLALPKIPDDKTKSVRMLRQLLSNYEQNKTPCEQILSHTNVLDVLEAFPGMLTLQKLCAIQGANYRRVYTIAGIERDAQGKPKYITASVATQSGYTVPNSSFGAGNYYRGVGAQYIEHLFKQRNIEPQYTDMFVQRRSFGPPEKDRNFGPGNTQQIPNADFLKKLKMPLLMVVNGCGISGALSVLQQRKAWQEMGYEVGKATLVMGLRNCDTDFLFKQEIHQYIESGLLERFTPVESRPANGKGRYVQHALLQGECDKELTELANRQRALVVCGDKRMGEAVVQGVLSARLPELAGTLVPTHLRSTIQGDSETCLKLKIKCGENAVNTLKKDGFILQSTSGSRYEEREVSAYQAYCEVVPVVTYQHR